MKVSSRGLTQLGPPPRVEKHFRSNGYVFFRKRKKYPEGALEAYLTRIDKLVGGIKPPRTETQSQLNRFNSISRASELSGKRGRQIPSMPKFNLPNLGEE